MLRTLYPADYMVLLYSIQSEKGEVHYGNYNKYLLYR